MASKMLLSFIALVLAVLGGTCVWVGEVGVEGSYVHVPEGSYRVPITTWKGPHRFMLAICIRATFCQDWFVYCT